MLFMIVSILLIHIPSGVYQRLEMVFIVYLFYSAFISLDRPHNHYPVLNVTAENDYKYFVNQFNFEDAPDGQFFIGAE